MHPHRSAATPSYTQPQRRPQVKASWTAVYGIIAKTMIGDNYPEKA